MSFAAKLITCALCLFILLPAVLSAKSAQYIGAKKCKMCHNKKSEVKQFDIWKNSSHAKAYETLATEEALKMAAKKGIKGDPQKAKECLECHVTGYGKDSTMFAKSYVMEDGVQCESCHGPGSLYKSAKIMSKTKYASNREAQHKLALEAGLIIPDEKTCKQCHNERSPAYKGFEYKTYFEKMKHNYDR